MLCLKIAGQVAKIADPDEMLHYVQGSGNFEIWIGPADYVINEPISKKKYVYITCHEN